jgi:hypothetical protein
LFANWLLKPRAVIAQVFESMFATWSPGTMRNRSGTLVMPERRMSSDVITVTAAGACDSGWARFDTVVTSTFIRSSMLRFSRSTFSGSAALTAGAASRDAHAIAIQ